jgi:competence protein ComEC
VRLPIRILGKFKNCADLGSIIKVSGRFIESKEQRVAGTLIATREFEVLEPASAFSKFLSGIRADFRSRSGDLGGDAGALIPGMILGDTSLQGEQFTSQMRRAGLSHLTAVSGANFAIVSALVFYLFRGVVPRIIPRLILTAIFLVIFLFLVRPSPSVLRAGVMAAVVLLSKASGNARNSVAALATAIAVLLLLDPFQAVDPGFALSVLATSGLIFIAPRITERLKQYLPEWLAEIISIPCAATVTCTPYIIFLSGEISILSVLFNVLVAPVVAPITILGFIAVLALPIPFISEFLLLIAKGFSQWIVYISGLTNHVPSWGITPLLMIILIALVSITLQRRSFSISVVCVLVLLTINFAPRVSFPGNDWKVLQCDVGQGDALLINLGRGSAILFDAGPDPNLMRRCLSVAKIDSIALLVISHGHADHYFGMKEISSRIDVGTIWSNGSASVREITQDQAIKVDQGVRAHIGEVTLEVLWPNPVLRDFANVEGDGSSENNRSLVVLVIMNGLKILVTGDIEPEVQRLISEKYDLRDIDILKVPHHGSRFQDSSFISEVSPELSFISVGAGNAYGHPNSELIQELTERGSKVARTDRDGPISVSWRFDDSAKRYIFTMKTMRKEWWRIQWL